MTMASAERSATAQSKSGEAFRTIGEVSQTLDLPQHVLRFWETRFSQIRPLKRGGNRRYYRPEDIELLRAIKTLLYEEGYTIKGVQKRFREQGVKATVAAVLAYDMERGEGEAETAPAPSRGRHVFKQPGPAASAAPGGEEAKQPGTLDLEAILAELRALRQLLD